MALWLLAPTFNEEANVGRLLDSVRAQPWVNDVRKFIIVDDGSKDRTVERAREASGELPLEITEHVVNRGPGAAFRTGFHAVLKDADPSDVVLTFEADCSVDLSVASAMLSQIEGGSDVCLASCYAPGGRVVNVPPVRRALSRAANRFIRIALGLNQYRTCSSFYRAYRVRALQQALTTYGDDLITEPGFASMVELLLKLDRLGLRITEAPCTNDWGASKSSSSLPVWRTIQRYLAIAARHRRTPRIGAK